MAVPEINAEQIAHLIHDASVHHDSQATVNRSVGIAIAMTLYLILQDLDQLVDIAAAEAGLKSKNQITVT